jgi:4-amino-4-deoxy-L-arabinose transferase-like glycosyltransferase
MTVVRQIAGRFDWRKLRLAPWIALVGMIFIVRGQWAWFDNLDTSRPGNIPVLVGLLLLLFSLSTVGIVTGNLPLFASSVRRRLPFTGKLPFALAGVGMCIYAGWRAFFEVVPVWDIFIMWGAGIWLTLYGCVPHDHMAAWGRKVWRSLREERKTWLLIGLLFVVGLLIRVIDLENQPYIMAGDEAQFAYEAASLKDNSHWIYNPFQMGLWHHPRIVHTLMGISIASLGQTIAAARMPWAILGALTIPAVYLLGRRLFDHRMGLVAALFMVSFPVHVMFSRTAMDMTGDPLFLALALACMTAALRDGDMMEAALAGLFLGLSQYFYFAGRIAGPVMVAYVIWHFLRDWRATWQRIGPLIVALVLVFVVTFPNFYATDQDTERPLSPRLSQVSIWETGSVEAAQKEDRLGEFLVDQIEHGLLAYFHFHDESDVYGRYNPVLGWYGGVPCLIGLIVVLRRWRDPRFILPALWATGTALLGGAMLIDPPHYPRYINPDPALALLVALGVGAASVTAIELLRTILRQFSRYISLRPLAERSQSLIYAAWLLPILIGLGLSLANARSFIFSYLPATEERQLLYGEATIQLNEIAGILDTFGEHYQVRHFSSMGLDMNGTDLLRYLAPENAGLEFGGEPKGWSKMVTPGLHAFVIAPDRYGDVGEQLVSYFPGGDMVEYSNSRTGQTLIFVYFVNIVNQYALPAPPGE